MDLKKHREGLTQNAEDFDSKVSEFLSDIEALIKENIELRRLLLFSRCEAPHTDDGELQDNTKHPTIDYLRFSVDEINAAMGRRFELSLKDK
jgi:hypothetical protein